MPSSWNVKICNLYNLNEAQKKDFTSAIAETENAIEMDFVGANIRNRELAVSFARKFSDIDDDQVEAIKKILFGGKTK